MPGPAMHHMIADRLRLRIMESTGLGATLPPFNYRQLQSLFSNPRNLPYYYLGCQGPDFLFFNTKDMPSPLHDLVTAYFKVTDFIEDFKNDMKKLVPQPVLDALAALDEAANAVISSSSTLTELEQLFGDMKKVINAASATLMEAVKRYVSDFNLFELVGHPYRDGVPAGGKWWWFDAMHYRRTGEFAQALLRRTTPGSPLHLYAIGYLSHVTADTVGHPYVNSICGGPFRSHAQRHKASENYQDVLNFRNARAEDWNFSRLHALYNFNFNGTIDTGRDIPDRKTNLPDDLARLITETLSDVYNENSAAPRPDYGATITPEDLNDTYRLWYRWFRNATDTGVLPPPVPYSFSAELREVWDKAMDNLGDVGDFISDAANTSGSYGIWGIFLLLGALILAALAAAAAVIDAVLGSLTTLGSATIRYAASLVYEQLYSAFHNFRLAVAMNGLAFPLQEHLTEPRITHFGNPSIPDILGQTAALMDQRLPLLRWSMPGLTHQERHLVYPPTGDELHHVFGVPANYLNQTSAWYGWGDITRTPDLVRQLSEIQSTYPGPGQNDASRLVAVLNDNSLLGNALDLTASMYDWHAGGNQLPDFNLDGDRGYGYLCWQQAGDPAPDFPRQISSESPTGPSPVQIDIIR